jgi:hypothetical protein
MSYTLHSVALSDIEDLVRYCDHPAMQENPLHMTMFPTASPESREEEIMWHVSSFLDSFEKSSGAYFRKVCHNGNTPVGFALWSLDQTCLSLRKESRPEVKVPRSLDVCAWRELSRRLSSERQRVLKGLDNVWSKSICIPPSYNVANISYTRNQRIISQSSSSTSRMWLDAPSVGL